MAGSIIRGLRNLPQQQCSVLRSCWPACREAGILADPVRGPARRRCHGGRDPAQFGRADQRAGRQRRSASGQQRRTAWRRQRRHLDRRQHEAAAEPRPRPRRPRLLRHRCFPRNSNTLECCCCRALLGMLLHLKEVIATKWQLHSKPCEIYSCFQLLPSSCSQQIKLFYCGREHVKGSFSKQESPQLSI